MFESIRVGDVLQFVGFLVGGAIFFFGMRQKIELIGQRLGFLENTVKNETEAQKRQLDKQSIEIGKLGELLVQMGRYEERMLRYDDRILIMQREIEGLKNGQGWINGPRLANAGAGPGGALVP